MSTLEEHMGALKSQDWKRGRPEKAAPKCRDGKRETGKRGNVFLMGSQALLKAQVIRM